jgi:hypothetical protein
MNEHGVSIKVQYSTCIVGTYLSSIYVHTDHSIEQSIDYIVYIDYTNN